MQTFYSNGKLLLTGEYLVLDGANALAVPSKFGQSLTVANNKNSEIFWQSLNHSGSIWFEAKFPIDKLDAYNGNSKQEISRRIVEILNAAKQLNPDFLASNIVTKTGFNISTKLDFPENWGLGSSSTLINNIATWSQVNPYELLNATFGGSGYDIACAQNDHPILYRLNNNEVAVDKVEFNPSFKDQLFFIHLNKKQNSREGIAHYNSNKANLKFAISEINDLTEQFIKCQNLAVFKTLIDAHEQIISKLIKMQPIKKQLFSDYQGSIKSLGAWGGDFIMVTGTITDMNYFKTKGFNTILKYDDMVLNEKSTIPT